MDTDVLKAVEERNEAGYILAKKDSDLIAALRAMLPQAIKEHYQQERVLHIDRRWIIGFIRPYLGLKVEDVEKALDDLAAEGVLIVDGPNKATDPYWRLS